MRTLQPFLIPLLIALGLDAPGAETTQPKAADGNAAEAKPGAADTAKARAARLEEFVTQRIRQAKAAAAETAEAKIARLEERVARLERIVERLTAPPSPELLARPGPNPGDRARFESLSDQTRPNFRDPSAAQGDETTEEGLHNFIVEIFEKNQAANKKGVPEGPAKASKEQPREKPPTKP